VEGLILAPADSKKDSDLRKYATFDIMEPNLMEVHMQEKKQTIQWQPIVELIVVLMTILGSTIPLYIHTDSKMEEHRRVTNELIMSIRDDMRDFHTKLALQDQEFKMRLCSIEERKKI